MHLQLKRGRRFELQIKLTNLYITYLVRNIFFPFSHVFLYEIGVHPYEGTEKANKACADALKRALDAGCVKESDNYRFLISPTIPGWIPTPQGNGATAAIRRVETF